MSNIDKDNRTMVIEKTKLTRGPFPGQPYFVTMHLDIHAEIGKQDRRYLITLRGRESLGKSWGTLHREVLTFYILEGATTVGEIRIDLVEHIDRVQISFVGLSTKDGDAGALPAWASHIWHMPQEILSWVADNHLLMVPEVNQPPAIVSVETQWDVLD